MKWESFNITDLTCEEYLKWYSLMSSEKQDRVSRFRFTEDRKRTVAGEMLARRMISAACNINAETITFGYGSYGKPFVYGNDVQFNISHSGDMVICAVNDSPVGIDIERIRPIDLRVAGHICTDKELFYIFGHQPSMHEFCFTENYELLFRFFNIWVNKEAYSKFLGNQFVNSEIDAGRISPILLDEQYIAAICFESVNVSALNIKL